MDSQPGKQQTVDGLRLQITFQHIYNANPINEANEAELTLLPHIGPSLANKIILYRSSAGAFQKVEDLQNVKGIGPKIVDQVKDYCTVE